MRRIALIAAALMVLPISPALATDLDELLARGHEASYSAEQIISCSTPDGVRDAVVRITQAAGELTVSSNVTNDVEVTTGEGGWALTRSGGVVAEAAVDGSDAKADPLYRVDDLGEVTYLGREAKTYSLARDGVLRAQLTVDDVTGALVEALTFALDGEIYCERRFVSLDPTPMAFEDKEPPGAGAKPPDSVDDSRLPENVAGFERLDHYEDEDGLRFAYYSDGFFSFAVFESPTPVLLPDASPVVFESGSYDRAFTAGQVTFAWETLGGGMALVGDLPPDLHEAVLSEMPHPQDPGFFRRWWRNLFG